MKQNFFIIIVLLLCFIKTHVSAQEIELSLNRSIEIALEQNLQYQSARKSLDIARAKTRESISGFLPKIDATLIHNLDEKLMQINIPPLAPGMDPIHATLDFTKDYMAVLALKQPIFAGTAIWSNYRQNYYNLKAEEQKCRQQKLTTIFNVKKSYYSVLLTGELVKVSEEAYRLSESLFNNTRLLYDQGLASKFQVLNSEVEMENVKPRLIEAENNRNLTVMAFKNLLQLNSHDGIRFSHPLKFVEQSFSLDSLLTLVHTIRPGILEMLYQKNRMDKLVDLARSSFSPALFLTADYNYRRDQFSWDPGNWEDYYTVNLVLSIPLFQGGQRLFKVQQARVARQQVEVAVKAVTTGAELEVKKNYLKFNEALEKIKSHSKEIERAEENVRIASLNYREGLITPLEMSVAQMNLIQTRTLNLKALYDYLISLAALERSVGIENIN